MIDLIADLKSKFESASEINKSQKMNAYMKNHFEFYGIPSPIRKELQKAFVRSSKQLPIPEFQELIRDCWSFPEREWQYTAVDALKAYKRQMDQSFLRLTESLILKKSWWDTVDFLSSDIAGFLFQKFDSEKDIMIRKWIHSNELWLERSALLHQLKYAENIDGQLLDYLIDLKKNDSEFFIH